MTVGFDYSKSFIKKHEVDFMKPFLKEAHNLLHDGDGPGNEFIGWLDWTEKYDRQEYEKIKTEGRCFHSGRHRRLLPGCSCSI
mgnify:CR=1 FL=1